MEFLPWILYWELDVNNQSKLWLKKTAAQRRIRRKEENKITRVWLVLQFSSSLGAGLLCLQMKEVLLLFKLADKEIQAKTVCWEEMIVGFDYLPVDLNL